MCEQTRSIDHHDPRLNTQSRNLIQVVSFDLQSALFRPLEESKGDSHLRMRQFQLVYLDETADQLRRSREGEANARMRETLVSVEEVGVGQSARETRLLDLDYLKYSRVD